MWYTYKDGQVECILIMCHSTGGEEVSERRKKKDANGRREIMVARSNPD